MSVPNASGTREIYTLSLHDALPIYRQPGGRDPRDPGRHGKVARVLRAQGAPGGPGRAGGAGMTVHTDVGAYSDRKSTRLNSSHPSISYADYCLKKNKRYRSCE